MSFFSATNSQKRTKKNSGDESDIDEVQRKHRSDSPENGRSKRRHKKSKRKHDRSVTPLAEKERIIDVGGPVTETEEEYDARLEREENERREAERRKELERIRRQYDDAARTTDGVRFKGVHNLYSLIVL